ncbi:phosphoribosyltransferase [Glycomyces sp. NPDC048151]|uniref:phosphoribosyltransferase n=1 Tax=Glycomyces sp. NPDC048151 TaxID=3364002 RepID=UPI0037145B02
MGDQRFADRADAGRALALRLVDDYYGRDGLLVLGLPRGGVPVAYEVAMALEAPLDVFTVRKIGVPGREELAMGAVASGGAVVMNYEVADMIDIAPREFDEAAERALAELARREEVYTRGRPPLRPEGRTVMLVDDGLATGATMRAAVRAVSELGPERVVVAVPCAPKSAVRELSAMVDELVCVSVPPWFQAVGQCYERFDQTSDEAVGELLEAAASRGER